MEQETGTRSLYEAGGRGFEGSHRSNEPTRDSALRVIRRFSDPLPFTPLTLVVVGQWSMNHSQDHLGARFLGFLDGL
jgi:hypothetical protein